MPFWSPQIMSDGHFVDGRFAIGQTTQVNYKATDKSGNNSTCSMDIVVQGDLFKKCQSYNCSSVLNYN